MFPLAIARRSSALLRHSVPSRRINAGPKLSQSRGPQGYSYGTSASTEDWAARVDKMENMYNKISTDMSKATHGQDGRYSGSMWGLVAGLAVGYLGHWMTTDTSKSPFATDFHGNMQEVKSRLTSIQHSVDQLKPSSR
ncbi:unnamed protein product [Aphanomyces euteiches]|uniref:Uncharacterized protein n=1 Tax=Aphanomyces euteiches TaxID=100861 RepID=A0A6G0XBV3_9STRA|nr:hypothetical protein Ae201684_006654 [Aphanomyces euteiches]KAH9091071.1 hypothetical protein Ae201684P_006472 [Aphanomyces euteiches]KAH9148787.1 hypothetical protein AeRB84_007972 [Aphanomyces euteiches]